MFVKTGKKRLLRILQAKADLEVATAEYEAFKGTYEFLDDTKKELF